MGLASALSTALTGLSAAETTIRRGGQQPRQLEHGRVQGVAGEFRHAVSADAAASGPLRPATAAAPIRARPAWARWSPRLPRLHPGDHQDQLHPHGPGDPGRRLLHRQGATGEHLYTRNGEFKMNSANEIVTTTREPAAGLRRQRPVPDPADDLGSADDSAGGGRRGPGNQQRLLGRAVDSDGRYRHQSRAHPHRRPQRRILHRPQREPKRQRLRGPQRRWSGDLGDISGRRWHDGQRHLRIPPGLRQPAGVGRAASHDSGVLGGDAVGGRDRDGRRRRREYPSTEHARPIPHRPATTSSSTSTAATRRPERRTMTSSARSPSGRPRTRTSRTTPPPQRSRSSTSTRLTGKYRYYVTFATDAGGPGSGIESRVNLDLSPSTVNVINGRVVLSNLPTADPAEGWTVRFAFTVACPRTTASSHYLGEIPMPSPAPTSP